MAGKLRLTEFVRGAKVRNRRSEVFMNFNYVL